MNSFKLIFKLGALCSFLFVAACSRPSDDGKTKVQVSLPNSKPGNTSASFTCYAIMVAGDGIANQNAACLPEKGLVQGFVQEGGTIELSVPKGPKRDFILYSSTGTSCRPFAEGTREVGFQFHKVGETLDVNVSLTEMSVTINAANPSAGNLVTVPANCQTANTASVQMRDQRVSVGVGVSSDTVGGQTLVLESRINFVSTGTVAP